jgi:S1-C subfamily serine protease
MLVSCLAMAQGQNAKLTIKAALVDKDLNVKPVPKLALTLRPVQGGAGITAITGFNGAAEVELPAGTYHVTNAQPVEFQGKKYTWNVDLQVKPGQNVLELSNDNALATEAPTSAGRKTDELSAQFKQLQNSVVTVWGQIGTGTGFLIEPRGLIVTNQHVIVKSDIISVQFDTKRKVSAILLASDPQKDVAVLWADLSGIPEAITAPIIAKDEAAVIEGERVMTIGSPLTQRKILTTGIVSKVEARAIISDIRIDHGNSGGPLFNSLGKVVGITTFGQGGGGGGGGVSGIVRIEEAQSVIEEAKKKKLAVLTNPAPDFLPVEPEGTFPLDALKKAIQQEKFDTKPYRFEAGDYNVWVITPQLRYYSEEEDKIQAAKAKNKRNKAAASEEEESDASDDLKSWGEYAGGYKATISIRATPKLRETTGSKWRRGMLGVAGGPATIRFKTDFYKMKLLCGDKEVAPIHPGKVPLVFNERNWLVNLTDASFAGWYSYGPEAISPSCGQITLELYAANSPSPITTKILDLKTVSRVWEDFEPYRAVQKKSEH